MRPDEFTPERGVLTVGELRTMLLGVPHETPVVLEDGNGWYVNTAKVAAPHSEDSDWSCVTLFPGVPFDSRQV